MNTPIDINKNILKRPISKYSIDSEQQQENNSILGLCLV